MRFVDDERVRPALLDVARRADAEDLANFAQVSGLVGGAGARDLLRKRVEEIALDPLTFADPFFNWRAGSLGSSAEALLRLDADAETGIAALIRLLDHPCAFNRQSAMMNIVEVLERGADTDAMRRLREALDPLLTSDDAESFLASAKALFATHRAEVLARCKRLLDSDADEVCESATWALAHFASLPDDQARTILLARLPNEPSVDRAVSLAEVLGDAVPKELLAEVVQRGLASDSPLCRWTAAELLSRLPPEAALALAAAALSDEPEELVARRLRGTLETVLP